MRTTMKYLKGALVRARKKCKSKGVIYIIKKTPITIRHMFLAIRSDVAGMLSTYSSQELWWKNKSEEDIKEKIPDDEASALLSQSIKQHVDKEIENLSILEIGTNVGRRSNHLYEKGAQNLAGIEINPDAIELMKKEFPDLHENMDIKVGGAQEKLSEFDDDSFDVVFSISVLMHIRSNEDDLFDEMARVCDGLIITFECENQDHALELAGIEDRTNGLHSQRNYGKIFEERGFSNVETIIGWDDADERTEMLNPLSQHGKHGIHTVRILKKE